MIDTQAETLDEILCKWHAWQLAQRASRGWVPKALVCGEYRVSRQYDDANGALDSDLDNRRSKQVDYDVCQMVDPYRAAIYVVARNLSTGREVWFSPRIPSEPEARAQVVVTARCILTKKLVASGLI